VQQQIANKRFYQPKPANREDEGICCQYVATKVGKPDGQLPLDMMNERNYWTPARYGRNVDKRQATCWFLAGRRLNLKVGRGWDPGAIQGIMTSRIPSRNSKSGVQSCMFFAMQVCNLKAGRG